MRTQYHLYADGVSEIQKAGYAVSAGSYANPNHVAVFSVETIPNTYGASRVCFNAILRDGEWIVQRIGYSIAMR